MKSWNPSIPSNDAVIFVSIELSKKAWLIGIHTPLVDKVGLHLRAQLEACVASSDVGREHGKRDVAIPRVPGKHDRRRHGDERGLEVSLGGLSQDHLVQG